ncbi:MAG: YajQ family cyclic di-GMP-binding protein [Pseudomonadota bacterium]|nr:YajQ family cyclic di-GMP-binding protein [Pseudomonadota bacterium]
MPSFDVVSQVDMQEVRNAADQANREIGARYDFKGSDARIEPHIDQKASKLQLYADDDYKVGQVLEILQLRLSKRGVDIGCLDAGEVKQSPTGKAQQELVVRQGIGQELGKKLVKLIKGAKLKVQASIQSEQVRVSGKKRDDLQNVIALLREKDYGLPLQFVNFRD